MLLKQLILLLSIAHFVQCLSIRSNIWWSRRNDNSELDCDLSLDYDNPSIAAKICGYCFAKCQQNFGACLLAHIKEGSNDAIEFCQGKTNKCQKYCFNDKRTSRIAEAKWAQVVQFLHRYYTVSDTDK